MNPLTDFMNSAKGLTKNPLGIIGLFISLIYGFACLVLSTSIANLQATNERIPLIWFIIIFPIIILGTFLYLVVNHHEKLYAPSDFRNDDAFIETMSLKKVREKQENEARLLNSADVSRNEIQKSQTHKVKDLPMDINPEDSESEIYNEELSTIISNSERWAIKDLELEYNIPFKTNQRLLSNNIKLELDAYASDSNRVFIAEVKYWQSHKSIKPLLLSLQEFILKFDSFKRAFNQKDMTLTVVIVFDKLTDSNVNKIKAFVSDLDQNVNVIFKEYLKLKEDYKE